MIEGIAVKNETKSSLILMVFHSFPISLFLGVKMGQNWIKISHCALWCRSRTTNALEEIAFTAQPKINSQSQIFRYGRSTFCLPHQPKISCFFEVRLHWVSVVCELNHLPISINSNDTNHESSVSNLTLTLLGHFSHFFREMLLYIFS